LINGKVTALQACIGVTFLLPERADLVIEFVVDTGFEGSLTLPPAAIAALGLPYLTDLNANLANDANVRVDVHVATIVWDGQEREVAVLAMGKRPLLGTALLQGHHLGADFTEDGTVNIHSL
jgi:clan AA aspartic protease